MGRSRSRRIVLITLLCVLGLLVLVAAGLYWQRVAVQQVLADWTGEEELVEQLKGTLALLYLRVTQTAPDTQPFVPIAHTGVSPYGVNTFLEQEADPAKVEQSIELIAAAGFHWIRQEFPWEDIEISGKGDFWDHKWDISTWDKYDRIVDLANAHGLELIVRLDNPPAWTRAVGDAPGWTMAPPDNYEDFGDFVYTVVSRYRGQVRYYQIWNEPNIYPEWGDQPADPAAYVELLKIAYQRAKEADPDCVIIAAGLAQTTEETPIEFGPRNMSDLLYLEKMYQAGVKGYFDIMGAMAYGLWTGPMDHRTSRDRANFARPQLLRAIMVRYGDADKPIWATEIGWNAVPADFAGSANYGRVSEQQQATYAVQAYERARSEWPWMGVMNYWFFRRPSDQERDQSWYYFRMLEPDFTPLPVYAALSQEANADPRVPIGYHQEDHWALRYSGNWTPQDAADAVLGGYTSGETGSGLTFTFEGTHLALVLRDPGQLANLQIEIDGRVVRPPSAWVQRPPVDAALPVAAGLADGPHQVRLQVVQGQVALDGLVVYRQGPGRLIWAGILAALLLAGLLLAWLAHRRGAHE